MLMTAHRCSRSRVELQKVEDRNQADQAYQYERQMKIGDCRIACRVVAQERSDPQSDRSRSDAHTHRHLLDHAGKCRRSAHLPWRNIGEAERDKARELHRPTESPEEKNRDNERRWHCRGQKGASEQREGGQHAVANQYPTKSQVTDNRGSDGFHPKIAGEHGKH